MKKEAKVTHRVLRVIPGVEHLEPGTLTSVDGWEHVDQLVEMGYLEAVTLEAAAAGTKQKVTVKPMPEPEREPQEPALSPTPKGDKPVDSPDTNARVEPLATHPAKSHK